MVSQQIYLPLKARIDGLLFVALIIMLSAVAISADASGVITKERQHSSEVSAYILIANPAMNLPKFKQTVILVLPHSGQNTVGVILNKPMPTMLHEYFPERPVAKNHIEPVFYGGADSSQAYTFLMRSQNNPGRSLPVITNYWLSVDSNLLQNLLTELDPDKKVRVYKGYSGWAPGQLQAEITHGMWYIIPAREDILLTDQPEALWQDLIAQIDGVSI